MIIKADVKSNLIKLKYALVIPHPGQGMPKKFLKRHNPISYIISCSHILLTADCIRAMFTTPKPKIASNKYNTALSSAFNPACSWLQLSFFHIYRTNKSDKYHKLQYTTRVPRRTYC